MRETYKILSILILSILSVKCQHFADQGGKALYTTPGLDYGNHVVEEKVGHYIPPQGYPVPIAMQNAYNSPSQEYYPASLVPEGYPAPAPPPAMEYNTYTYSTSTEAAHPAAAEENSEDGEEDGGDKETKQGGLAAADNPLNFLNLLGTDFQPGRLVNIFFGLFILLFMLVAQGYAMWVFGIAFLPGTRSLNDWKIDATSLDTMLVTVIDAFEYWESKQQNNRLK